MVFYSRFIGPTKSRRLPKEVLHINFHKTLSSLTYSLLKTTRPRDSYQIGEHNLQLNWFLHRNSRIRFLSTFGFLCGKFLVKPPATKRQIEIIWGNLNWRKSWRRWRTKQCVWNPVARETLKPQLPFLFLFPLLHLSPVSSSYYKWSPNISIVKSDIYQMIRKTLWPSCSGPALLILFLIISRTNWTPFRTFIILIWANNCFWWRSPLVAAFSSQQRTAKQTAPFICTLETSSIAIWLPPEDWDIEFSAGKKPIRTRRIK